VISVEETVSWLEETAHETLTQDTLNGWIKEGRKKLTIDDETNFCDPDLLRNVVNSKVRENVRVLFQYLYILYIYHVYFCLLNA
jgi:hypothetical protein